MVPLKFKFRELVALDGAADQKLPFVPRFTVLPDSRFTLPEYGNENGHCVG